MGEGKIPQKARLDELSATSAARSGALEELLAPLNDPELSAERRAAIEQAVQNGVADLAALAACAALPSDHSLRVAAAALDAALTAVTSAPVTDEEIALPAVSRRSPLAPWKLLVRAIACFYRGEDDACRECLGAIKPESVPARLVPAMHAMLTPGAETAAPLAPAAVALAARTTASSAALKNRLEMLDRAFADFANNPATGPSEGQILKLVRSAMEECRRSMPEQMETLKRLIYIRGSMNELDRPRMLAALEGMPRRDASFYRALAHGMETTGDPDKLAAACEYWDEFRQHAAREGWFAANGVEVATLYLHIIGVLRRIPRGAAVGVSASQPFGPQTRAGSTLLPFSRKTLCTRLRHRSASGSLRAMAPLGGAAIGGGGRKRGQGVAQDPPYGYRAAAPPAASGREAKRFSDRLNVPGQGGAHRCRSFRGARGAFAFAGRKRGASDAAEEASSGRGETGRMMAAASRSRQGDRPAFLAALPLLDRRGKRR